MGIPVLGMLTVGLLPSPLKVAWYRARGARIGKRVRIGLLSVITAREIEIGDDCRIGFLSFIHLKGALRLGRRVAIRSMVAIDTGTVEIGDDSVIMEQVIVGGLMSPRSRLSIGKRVKVFPHSFLNPTREIVIGDDVGVGGGNYIFTHGSWQNVLDGFQASFGPITIGRGTWLSWRVFITPNVTIGEQAIIGPGAVISQDVPDRGVARIAPTEVLDYKGRHIRNLSDRHRFKMLGDILAEYVEYQAWLGHDAALEQRDAGEIRLRRGAERVVARPSFTDPPPAAILVTLGPADAAWRQALTAAGVVWFDLNGKAALWSDAPLAEELRAWFSRFGIRFDYETRD